VTFLINWVPGAVFTFYQLSTWRSTIRILHWVPDVQLCLLQGKPSQVPYVQRQPFTKHPCYLYLQACHCHYKARYTRA